MTIPSRHSITWTIEKTAPLVREVGRLDFDILDERGRAVGFWALILERSPEDQRPRTREEKLACHTPPDYVHPGEGKPWVLDFSATRNGVRYGSSNPERYFADEIGARAYAEVAASDCHKRYARKYRANAPGGAA